MNAGEQRDPKDDTDIDEMLRAAGIEPSSEISDQHRAGFVAVVGRPNVGKSTLINRFLGEKIAITSPKPQTTRDRQLGILTTDEAQVIFVDTPGIHEARTRLGEFMVSTASSAISDADVVVFIVDVSRMPSTMDRTIAERLSTLVEDAPIILAMNKADLLDTVSALPHQAAYHDLIPEAYPLTLSATQDKNVDTLLQEIIERLPVAPPYYPSDQITDVQLRDNIADMIREKALYLFEQEVPHAVAVEVEEFKERSENLVYIAATIFVERESQKGILIGKGGAMLKRLGELARKDIEEILGTKVYLELWVKVLKNWRKDENALRRLGYSRKS